MTLSHKGRAIAAWAFEPEVGVTRGTAILVHGWEGRGGQLAGFVDPLLAQGFRVVTFDHVGHGESAGKRCSLPTMRDTLQAVADQVLQQDSAQGEGPAAIVAHSMGSFATTLVLAKGWRSTRVVYVSPPSDMLVYFGHYLELATGSRTLLPDVFALLEARHGERTEDFEFRRLADTLVQPLLVLHSADDADVPLEGAHEVVSRWPGARLEELDGLGHRRILRDAGVRASAARFLAEG